LAVQAIHRTQSITNAIDDDLNSDLTGTHDGGPNTNIKVGFMEL